MSVTELTADRLHQPLTAATARSHIRRLLDASATGPPPRQAVVDDVLLVVTELITNAVRHGGGLTGFDARLDDGTEGGAEGGTITISVSDASPIAPRVVPRDRSATPGGFGWRLVRRLSRHIAITPTEGGKTIRVVMPTGRAV